MVIEKIIHIVKNFPLIIRGWYYKLFNIERDLASIRLSICNKCEHKVETSLGDACGQCGCILDAKARVEDAHCDLHKW